MFIHSDARARISPALAVLDGDSYPIAAIAAVKTREIAPPMRVARVLCLALGLPLALLAAATALAAYAPQPMVTPQDARTAIGAAVLAAALISAAIVMGGARPSYALVVVTTGGEKTALVAYERDYVETLRRALDLAVISSNGMTSAEDGKTPR